jgi:osmotically-inducible protein OsmY
MSRTFIPFIALAVGAVIITGTPAQAAHDATGAAMQQPAPADPPQPPPQGTKGTVAAGDAKDVGKVAVEKAGAAIEKAAVATKDAVVTASKKTKEAVGKGGEKTDETWLTTKIAGKINADEALEDVDVDVKVKKNVVTITGDVPSVELRDRVLRIARETEGVADVIDRMTVRATLP